MIGQANGTGKGVATTRGATAGARAGGTAATAIETEERRGALATGGARAMRASSAFWLSSSRGGCDERNRQAEVMMSSGALDKVKGRAKETAGALVGDNKLKREGKADQ